jgi:hypothetical protein
MTQFFLGAHRPHWLSLSAAPLFVSDATLRVRGKDYAGKLEHRAIAPWGLDSGAFSEVSKHGQHLTSASSYAARVRRYHSEIGQLAFASVQDWMCEEVVLKRTGLTVREHQRRTVRSYLELCELAPELPWMPVLQGWGQGDHMDHLEMYDAAGVDLRKLPRVGVGSVCRRQGQVRISLMLGELQREGLQLHGFGVKADGIALALEHMTSCDSMAWSQHERKEHRQKLIQDPTLPKTGKQNDLGAALDWLGNTVDATIARARRAVTSDKAIVRAAA